MLAFSFAGVFIALVPVLLEFLAVPDPELWKISLLVLAATTLGGALFGTAGARHLSSTERSVLNKRLTFIVLSLLLVAGMTETVMAFASTNVGPGVFFAGLLVLLAMSVYLVARFLFARPAA